MISIGACSIFLPYAKAGVNNASMELERFKNEFELNNKREFTKKLEEMNDHILKEKLAHERAMNNMADELSKARLDLAKERAIKVDLEVENQMIFSEARKYTVSLLILSVVEDLH